MDLLLLPEEELQALTPMSILLIATSIPRSSPATFSLVTLILVFPLSFAALVHTLFTHPILLRLESSSSSSYDGEISTWILLLNQFIYLLLLFTFSLVSNAAVVFCVASLVASRPVSFLSTLSAIPPVFSRLFRTLLWFSAVMAAYNLFFVTALHLVFLLTAPAVFGVLVPLLLLAFLGVHIYISAVWHLACVVTVLEPLRGLGAMRKSRDLIRGKGKDAAILVLLYLMVYGVVSFTFRVVVLKGEAGVMTKVLVGGLLVAVLVVVNMVGLLVQSVFYYVCKSYHHQTIDKSTLGEHLGGYLGEYVPLNSDIQMENI